MTRRDRLRNALEPVFQSVGATRTDLKKIPGLKGKPTAQVYTFYEAYLYAQVLLALDRAGMNPSAEPVGAIFRFRRAPGEIYKTPDNFSYTVFTGSSSSEYEMHGDTYVASRMNGSPMEVDVMVVSRKHGEQCRKNKKQPSYRRVWLIVESKYHRSGIGMTDAKLYHSICSGVKRTDCVEALVSNGRLSSDAGNWLAGCKPPLTVHPTVSPITNHKANVAAFGLQVENGLKAVT